MQVFAAYTNVATCEYILDRLAKWPLLDSPEDMCLQPYSLE